MTVEYEFRFTQDQDEAEVLKDYLCTAKSHITRS